MRASTDGPRIRPGNQRARVRMTASEIDDYLRGHTSDIVMSTMHPDGSIHSVAMYYGFADGRLGVLTKQKSQKARNVRRDPRATFLVTSGTHYDELRGVELAGRVDLSTDRALMLRLAESIRTRRGQAADPQTLCATVHNRVAIMITPSRVVSWDHAKLVAAQDLIDQQDFSL